MSSMLPFLVLVLLANTSWCHADGGSDQPVYKLESGVSIPLIGMGIGNLAHENIPEVVSAQLETGVQLIDTAHASKNERILGEAIASFDSGAHSNTRGGHPNTSSGDIHVVTKVWYTHLGYERTKLSVQESLQDLQTANTRQVFVHMLLHWPRCNDDIPWMNCEEEEQMLPQEVKDAGPPPHLSKDGAFLESWKALEDIFTEHQSIMKSRDSTKVNPPIIASIGVSNFELNDMKSLLETSRIAPHMYQGNSWLVFHDPYLTTLLSQHNIFFQAYAVMNGILFRNNEAPNAFNALSIIARELMGSVGEGATITEATVLLAYFLHKNVGVIPRAASSNHQRENSPESLSAILPHLTADHINQLELAISALMKGEDIHIHVSFMNSLSSPIQVHWIDPETKEEILVSNSISPGSVEVQQSHPGHRFVAYDPERSVRKEFLVDAGYGQKQHFSVEL